MQEPNVEALDASVPREEAIPRLLEAHGGKLFALGMRLCGSREEAEDLVQETFLQAYRNWDRFEGRSKPSTWLYTIASHACQRFHRKRVGEPDRLASLDELMPAVEPTMAVASGPDGEPLASELRAETRRELEQAIRELPIDFRLPFVLKEVLGLSVADVAAALGIPAATVKTRLHRARLRLRKALEAGLPRRAVPPPQFSTAVCMDLLRAKQEALDHDADFTFPAGLFCQYCSELFATLDLGRNLCREISAGELPEELRAKLERAFAAAE